MRREPPAILAGNLEIILLFNVLALRFFMFFYAFIMLKNSIPYMQNLEAASVGGLPPRVGGANRGSAGRACGFSGGRGGAPARRLAADRAQEGASARETRRLKIRGRSPHKKGGEAATALPDGFGGGGFGATWNAEPRRRGGASEAGHGGTWPHSGRPASRARRKRSGTGRQTARGVAAP